MNHREQLVATILAAYRDLEKQDPGCAVLLYGNPPTAAQLEPGVADDLIRNIEHEAQQRKRKSK
jgi:hypothetical protein